MSEDSDELRMQQLLKSINGSGKVTVMLAKDEQNQITGAVVVSSGADNIRKMLEMQRVVQILTGLQLEDIEIVKSR